MWFKKRKDDQNLKNKIQFHMWNALEITMVYTESKKKKKKAEFYLNIATVWKGKNSL